MMGDIDQEKNYYRLIALLVYVSLNVVRCYFERHFLQGTSFKSYLEKNKHLLFHFSSIKTCCQCIGEITKQRRKLLSREHFLLLFEKKNVDCFSHGQGDRKCICKYSGKEVMFDLNLLICLLTHYKNEHENDNIDIWINHIQQVRSRLLHKSDKRSISKQDFDSIWNQMDGALIGFAGQIDNLCIAETRKTIDHLKTRMLSIEDKLQEIIFIKEWQLQKSCEMENLLQEVEDINKTAENDRRNFEKWLKDQVIYAANIDNELETITRQLDEISCKVSITQRSKDAFCLVNNTGKTTLPVLLHIEIPKIWNEAEINLGIEKTKTALDLLSGNLRIRYFSTDQNKMLLDIAKCLQYPIDNEIYGLLERILKTSKVDTTTQGSLSATLDVVAEEDIPTIPDYGIKAAGNVYKEKLDDSMNNLWKAAFERPETLFYIMINLCRVVAFLIFKHLFT